MLTAAGLSLIEHTTTHAGHATAIVQQLQLQGLRAVVLVGGDGTVWEALQVMPFVFVVMVEGLSQPYQMHPFPQWLRYKFMWAGEGHLSADGVQLSSWLHSICRPC